MDSKIQEFYKNKTIFITGGSGFLGKGIIEKLLRSTQVKHIYVLIRPKRGVEIQSRITSFRNVFLFGQLLKTDPNFLDRVSAISGDIREPDLGLSEADRKLLIDEVQVVIHSAATVDFMAALTVSLCINTRATRLLIQLAKQMHRLEAFVHVSTAFMGYPLSHVNECFRPDLLTCTADKVLSLHEQLSDELINDMTPALLGKYPNTYTYTKALAEQVIQKEAGDLPVCIFRPGMILPVYKEPAEGWIDNLYGPISLLFVCAIGVLRVMIVRKDARSNIVPVDFCVNLIVSSAWKLAVESAQRKAKPVAELPAPDVTIYNFVPTTTNPLNWSDFTSTIEKRRSLFAFEHSIWFPYILTTTSHWFCKVLMVLYHHIPGFVIDVALRIKGKKPRMKKIYAKIHKTIRILSPFAVTNWSFDMDSSTKLLQCMSALDQKIFEFDMDKIIWGDYFDVALAGTRRFLAKESVSEESFAIARKRNNRLYVANFIVHIVAVCVPVAIIWYLVTRLTAI